MASLPELSDGLLDLRSQLGMPLPYIDESAVDIKKNSFLHVIPPFKT